MTPRSFVYLDSRIKGAARQLVRYFERGVFARESVTILYKRYPESERFYATLFERCGIPTLPLASIARLPDLEDAVVFYPFNAQSNCRLVAERGARHVFVTHGESNKAASYKPIIRLYDFVVTAGQAGKDRYVHGRVFRREEVESCRVVCLGDTFVGSTGYRAAAPNDDPYVLYAPTWEGGLESENYSSAREGRGLRHAAAYARATGVRRLIVQPHPNLGHRVPAYRDALFQEIGRLAREEFKIVLVGSCGWRDRWQLRGAWSNIEVAEAPPPLPVACAFADLSAMEAQLLNDGLNYRVLLTATPEASRWQPLLKQYYDAVGLLDWDSVQTHEWFPADLRRQVHAYYVSYNQPELARQPVQARMQWLDTYVRTNDYWEPPAPSLHCGREPGSVAEREMPSAKISL